ncbi:MAG: RraA family protein [Proteobacteria bacterium]|nr:RraA family protein [Pseudomonadota bacterium]MBU1740572.1 RraA family protein [Pseudomonadota bacterium]
MSPEFAHLSTPNLADACLRVKVALRIAPPGIRPVSADRRLFGRVLPVRHSGSVDIFFEAMDLAEPGDVLVIDNRGRQHEGCIGDLTALEAQVAGLSGIVVWGCHRDTTELIDIGLPVFSYGAYPAGPVRLDPRPVKALESAGFGPFEVDRGDVVFGDADGVIFCPADRIEEILKAADKIWRVERGLVESVRSGRTLRQQFRFSDYLARRRIDPDYSFRAHIKALGAAIEE